MTDILTVIVIIGLMSVPYLLLFQWFKLNRQSRRLIRNESGTMSNLFEAITVLVWPYYWFVLPKERLVVVLKYFSGMLCSLYVGASIVLWLYFWFIFQPDISPATSFSPGGQRLLGVAFYSAAGFLFIAPIVAASLAAYRSRFSPRDKSRRSKSRLPL